MIDILELGDHQPPAVSTLQADGNFYQVGSQLFSTLLVSWSWVDTTFPDYECTYQLFYKYNNGQTTLCDNLHLKEYELALALPGIYDITVFAISPMGIKSDAATLSYEYKVGVNGDSTLLPPTALQIENTSGTVFTGKDACIVWNYTSSNDSASDKLYDYVVEIWSADGTTYKKTYVVEPETSYRVGSDAKDGRFIFTLTFL